MNISLLNVKIKLQKSEITADDIGNRSNSWVDYYSCYATVSEETGKEKTTDFGTLESGSINFTIRWCNAIKNINSTQFRVIFEDDIYNITGINHQNYKKKSIKIRCELARR